MAKQKSGFEWQVIEDDEVWSSLQMADEPPATNRRWQIPSEKWFGIRLLQCSVWLGLALVVATGAAFSPSEHARLYAQAGIQTSLDLEAQARQTKDQALFNRLIDDQVREQTQSDWRNSLNSNQANQGEKILAVEPHGDLAVAKVLITRPNGDWRRAGPTRETRFYRQTADGWVRTVPDPAFWGNQYSLETAHLRFEFSEYDAQTVKPIAHQMETVYTQLQQMMNLTSLITPSKITFVVKPDTASNRPVVNGNRVEIASPVASAIPENTSDQTYLAQMIGGRLIMQAVNESLATPGKAQHNAQWQIIVRALNSWLRADLLDQRLPWHQQAEAAFRAESKKLLPLHVKDITEWRTGAARDQAQMMAQYIVAESLIGYTVNHYGQARLPVLLQAFNRYKGWSDLIPAVFGKSVPEFETGWNHYLIQHYGPSPNG